MKTYTQKFLSYLSLTDLTLTEAGEILETVQQAAIDGRIKEESLEFDAMELLKDVYYFLFGGDDLLWFYDSSIINSLWFENEEEAAEGLGIELEDLKEGYYYEVITNNGNYFKWMSEPVIASFCHYLKMEHMRQKHVQTLKVTINYAFKYWDSDGYYYSQSIKVPKSVKNDLIKYLKTNGARTIEYHYGNDTKRKDALKGFIKRLENLDSNLLTLTFSDTVFLGWFLHFMVETKRLPEMKRDLHSYQNTALIFY